MNALWNVIIEPASSTRGATCTCVVCLAELNSCSTRRRRLATESSKLPLPLLQSLGYIGGVTNQFSLSAVLSGRRENSAAQR